MFAARKPRIRIAVSSKVQRCGRSAPELRTLNHPNSWNFRGLQHPRNLVKAFVLTESNASEVIGIQFYPRARTDFSGGCRNCLVN
jgi:hypothetical protein